MGISPFSFGETRPNEISVYSHRNLGRLVYFDDGSWVIGMSHSTHTRDGLGDLTIIRTSNDKYYVNNGHVCDCLYLKTKNKVTSLETFLKTCGNGPHGEPVEWEEYKTDKSTK